MANGGAGMTSIDFGARGPSFSVASACASGGDGLGMAWLMIKAGLIDAAIAGASDALITPVSVAGLDRSGAMCRRDGESLAAPQPFDLNRDGFVIGEGAAVLVLEREILRQGPAGEDIRRNRGIWIHFGCVPYYFSAGRRPGCGQSYEKGIGHCPG